ncbi:MAG: CoA transferase [Archaeoglobaceae archaeon]|nr:CoA transferase [Archaeoglobaceae archaeon]
MLRMCGPLEGIRVVDISQFISGPFCSTLLGEMGAEVIKVEPKMGDTLRIWTSLIDPELEALFCALNKNKKGITLNVRAKEGAEIFKKLVSKSDVLVENLGVGVMDGFGLGYDVLTKLNPKLIYVSISGFGRTGPYKDRTAFDLIAQAAGGTATLVGRVGNKLKIFIADIVSGIYAALGAMFALYYREKTGKGQLVDISMQDVVFSLNLAAIVETALGEKAEKLGMSITKYPPGIKLPLYGIYPALDGEVAIAALTDSQAKRLFKAIALEEMANDERFSTFISRMRNEEELNGLLSNWTSKMSRKEITQVLTSARVPCSPVYEVSEVKNDEQLRARKMFVDLEYKGMKFPIPGICVKLSESPGSVKTAPELGQHNKEILSFLGYTEEEIKELEKRGVI